MINFKKGRAEIITEYGNAPAFLEKTSFYRSKNVFYLPEKSRWSYIVKNASADDIAVIIDTAMADVEERNEPLRGVLPTNFYVALGASK